MCDFSYPRGMAGTSLNEQIAGRAKRQELTVLWSLINLCVIPVAA
jgi:hypothetical protein